MTTVTGDDNVYTASYLSQLAGATLSSNTSTGFVLSADGYVVTVTGTGFTYSGNGPNAGTITGFSISGPGNLVTTVWSNLSVSAAQLWSDVKSADINDFNNLLYGGNDTFIADDYDSGSGAAFVGYGNGNETFDMSKATGNIGLIGGNGDNTFIFTSTSFNSGIEKTAILGGSGYNALDFTFGSSNDYLNLSDVGNIQTINLTGGGGDVYNISLGMNVACTINGTSLEAQDSMNITQFTTSSTPLYVYGGAGNDTVVIGGGNVTFNGYYGTNTVSFAQFTSGVTVDLGLTTQTINGATDTFVNVEDFIGTGHGDTFTDSTGKAVTVIATAGNDSITGSAITVDYSELPNTGGATGQGMTFNLSTGTTTLTKPYGDGTDTLSGIDGIVGTGYGDTFIPNSANDYFAEPTSVTGHTNTVDYANATGPMTFTQTSYTAATGAVITATGGGEGTDTLENINKIIGSPDGNLFVLDGASAYVQGSGSDTVILAEGSDYSLGTWGSTTADASGVTTLVSSGGIGSLYSSTGNDSIFLSGGGGNIYLATTGNHFVNTGHYNNNAVTTIYINDLISNYTFSQQGDRTIVTGPGGVDTFIGSGIIQFADDEVHYISNGGSPSEAIAPYDFDGRGTSDILLQNTDGQAAIWTQFGPTTVASNFVGSNPGPTWHVIGSGDFNNDGYADILWQNTDGSVAIWEMNGTQLLSTTSGIIGNPGPSWHAIGTGDFTGNGYSDILWQNTDGTVAIWELNSLGTSIAGGGIVTNAGPSWHAVTTGDFNDNGYSNDIVLQNNDGTVAIWEMNGTNIVGGGIIGNPGTSWHVIGTGDYYGTGYTNDILWQNTDGTVAIWEMNGTTLVGGGIVGSNPGTSWQVNGGTAPTSASPGASSGGVASPAGTVATLPATLGSSSAMSSLAGSDTFARNSILPISRGGGMFHAAA